jgi:hypothetical protein
MAKYYIKTQFIFYLKLMQLDKKIFSFSYKFITQLIRLTSQLISIHIFFYNEN